MCLSIDINECKEGLHGCHVNAICNNSVGSYSCTCKPGFIGDERNNCKGKVVIVVAFFIRALTTVHANWDLSETDKTAVKVSLLLSFSLSSPLESFTAPIPLPSPKFLYESEIA